MDITDGKQSDRHTIIKVIIASLISFIWMGAMLFLILYGEWLKAHNHPKNTEELISVLISPILMILASGIIWAYNVRVLTHRPIFTFSFWKVFQKPYHIFIAAGLGALVLWIPLRPYRLFQFREVIILGDALVYGVALSSILAIAQLIRYFIDKAKIHS